MIYTECTASTCPWNDRCSNQRFQRHEWVPGLELFETIDRGFGVRTCQLIDAGKYISVSRVVGLILHGVDPLSYFSFQQVFHDWCNKGRSMCYSVSDMMHIKEPLLLIGKSSPCGGSWFPLSLSEWCLTICLTPYNCR